MGRQEKSFKFTRAATPVLLKLGTQTRRVFRFSYCGESISLVSNFSQSPENITSGQSVRTNGSRIMNGKHPSVSGAVGARWQYRTIISNASHGVFTLLLRSVHRMMSCTFCPDVPVVGIECVVWMKWLKWAVRFSNTYREKTPCWYPSDTDLSWNERTCILQTRGKDTDERVAEVE